MILRDGAMVIVEVEIFLVRVGVHAADMGAAETSGAE